MDRNTVHKRCEDSDIARAQGERDRGREGERERERERASEKDRIEPRVQGTARQDRTICADRFMCVCV